MCLFSLISPVIKQNYRITSYNVCYTKLLRHRGEKEENWKGTISYNSGRVYIKVESGEKINSYILLSKGIYKDLGDNMYGYIFTSKAELVTGTVIITEICKAKIV